ncbi:MAG: eukaryotic-like serine/threonine-protein kinase [Verrucomicrobiota bacterium]|jgi:serine/threonine protein kinase
MRPEQAEQFAELVEHAFELEGAERAGFLAHACGDDVELRAEVEALLGEQERAAKLMNAPAAEFGAKLLPTGEDAGELRPGEMLGDCRIVSLLGEGGMGEVYLADDTHFGRQVAIKLIKQGFGTKEFVRHFRQEERILAALNHPNIARLYGGAVTPNGLPYFVMEYVEGIPLETYAAHHSLNIRERLALFRKVCAAVSYAHQNLVIHRDLKPANIRVTAEGEPKLLDFGIARLLDSETAQADNQTMLTVRAMTPNYASPEQLRGERMTTASDVYSLGVVLYELLAGQKPGVRKDGEADLKKLDADLDNILFKSLRLEQERRYSSVGQFSEDIRRYLEGLPVIARKDTLAYRTSKFVRRHKIGLAAAAAVTLLLIGATIVATWEAHRANEQRLLAERRFEQVRRLADSLMFEIHDSVKDLAGSTPTRRLIISRALEYLDSLAHDAGGNIALQRELATAYEKIGDIQGNPYSANIGDTDGALTSYRKALQIRESFKPVAATTDAQMELGRSHRSLGDIMEQKGDIEQMVREYRRSLLIFSQLAETEPKNPAVQDELARAYETLADGLGRTANGDAERLTTYKKSLAIREELLRQDNSNSKRQRAVAINLMKIGDVSDPHDPDAILSMRKGVVIFESLAAADPNNGRARREVGWGYYKLGGMLIAAEDYPGAVDSLQKSVAIREKSAVADPQNAQASFDLASTCVDLADALSTTGDTAQAVTQARRGIAIVTALLAADPTNAIYSRNLATYHNKLGDVFARSGADKNAAVTERLRAWSEARSSYEKAHEIFADLQAHGTLPPADAAEQPKEFARRMSDCQEAIKQLAAANSSP